MGYDDSRDSVTHRERRGEHEREAHARRERERDYKELDELECDADALEADECEPDVNQLWYQKMEPNAMPPPHIPPSNVPGTLNARQVNQMADALLKALSDDMVLRHKYYNLSRTWHNNSAGKGIDGGDFTKQWLRLLLEELPNGQGIGLNVNDFANIHRVMFLKLRRLMLAVTGHDVHPKPDDPPPGGPRTIAPSRSFHWVPNDGSEPLGTYNSGQLGYPADQP